MRYFSVKQDPEIFVIERDLNAVVIGAMHNQVETDLYHIHERIVIVCYLNRKSPIWQLLLCES